MLPVSKMHFRNSAHCMITECILIFNYEKKNKAVHQYQINEQLPQIIFERKKKDGNQGSVLGQEHKSGGFKPEPQQFLNNLISNGNTNINEQYKPSPAI